MSPKSRPLEKSYQSQHPLRTLFFLLGKNMGYYFLVVLLFVIKQAPALTLPFLLAKVVDVFSASEAVDVSRLPLYFWVMTILVVQNIFSHSLYVLLLSRAVRDMERHVRSALVTRLQQLSISFHSRIESGRLQAKVLRDAEQMQAMCMFLGEAGLGAVFTFLFAVTVTAIRAPNLLLFYLILVPLSVGLRMLFHKRIRQSNEKFRSEIERMSSETTEMINMIPVVRAHGLEGEAAQRSFNKFHAVREQGRRLDSVNAIFGSSAWATFQLTMIVGLAVLSWLCWQGRITVGDIVLFQSLFGMIVMSVTGLLNMIPNIAKGMESIRSIGEILECPDLEYNDGRQRVDSLEGRVAFEQVDFSYEEGEDHTVSHFSLDVTPGECIALVGPSGAGKSTLAQLLIGFYRPSSGRILLDGMDMEELDMRVARRFISVVPQETVLFSGTIRENILYGLHDVNDASLWQVLGAANLIDVVAKLPLGLETRIGEDGARLSGGQRQRIAIARALIRDPRILVLDEATSALDVVSEKLVQEAIDQAVKNRTTFIVAHRLSTIRKADRIVVMKEGRCEEVGSYDELMAKQGLFYEMQQLQS